MIINCAAINGFLFLSIEKHLLSCGGVAHLSFTFLLNFNDALGANKSAADQKNIMPEVNVQKNIDPVFTDADKTAWVLTNLISNAIRYSYQNSIIKICFAQSKESIIFTVEDKG